MSWWLRRLFRRPPTIRDCMRAAAKAPCEPLRAPSLPPDIAHAVNGPELVVRSLANRAWHYERLGEGPEAQA